MWSVNCSFGEYEQISLKNTNKIDNKTVKALVKLVKQFSNLVEQVFWYTENSTIIPISTIIENPEI